jgi:hypothetical protein
MKTLPEIEAEVSRLAVLIGASDKDLPTYGLSRDGGCPHIEIDRKCYHYVVVERGEELERRSTGDFDELLYWVFSSVTSSMAFSYEVKNRVKDQDCRRIAFPKQLELLNRISEKMGVRGAAEIEDILRRHPYDDKPTRAVNEMRRHNAT